VEELPPVVSMDEYSPSIAAESVSEGELERFWEDVKRQEDAYADEDERRLKTLEEKRKKLLDDVPLCLKRKAEEDDEQKAKIPRTMFQQLQVMVSDQEFKGLLRQKILKKGEERKRHSQWLPKEVKQIRRLLDLPVSAVRLHRTPRKKLQPVPNGKKRRRITIMLLEGPGEAMIVDESTKDMEKPRKTCSVAWRGLTVFVNPEAKKSKKEPPHKAYVQIDENTYEASLKSSEEVKIWKDLVEKEQVWQVYKQVLLLKLKASGKELDPRWFSEEEAQKFQDSDLREWEAWIKNGVIKRLTPEEAASVPKSAIFRLPLRIVRVGMQEIPFCRSTFVAKNDSGVFALCGLHVDDGFLTGNPRDPDFESLRKKIDQAFNIKAWEKIDLKGVDYLGMKVSFDQSQNVIIDDMTTYVLKIQPMTVPTSPGKLSSQDLTAYRQLVMKMRWPIQHVTPEYMFRASSLAQRVSTASALEAKEANQLLEEMHEAARAGEARLEYHELKGDALFVTYFDAALGKKDGTAQSGEVHVLTDSLSLSQPRRANIIEYHSNKIGRVVRSSLAAES
ncbi:Transposon Ty1-PL Gag-Pol polyprotein, partial [Durusdinium trenchii]